MGCRCIAGLLPLQEQLVAVCTSEAVERCFSLQSFAAAIADVGEYDRSDPQEGNSG